MLNDWKIIVLAWGVGLGSAYMVASFGTWLGLIDRPSSRSSHAVATPKGGGIGITLSLALTALWTGLPVMIWAPACALSLLSFWGDRRDISFKLRLGFQLLAAGAAAWQISAFSGDTLLFRAAGLFGGLVLSALCIAAVANLYNFMDGINGIAGISGLIAFGALAAVGCLRGEPWAWNLTAAAIAASCAGFLPLNFPRAKVFMGDVGSILLGFLFAVFLLAWSRSLMDVLLFLSFLGPFFVDEALTLWARLKSGDDLTKAHRRHVYQILVNQMGYAHWKISVLYGLTQLSVSVLTLYFSQKGPMPFLLWILFPPLLMIWFGLRIRRHE